MTWRRLPISGGRGGAGRGSGSGSGSGGDPFSIFFSLKRRAAGLVLNVTDLVHIWSARGTSREELKAQAVRTGCAIDPNEDDEQYEVLVGKLEEAVCGRGGATVRLVVAASAPAMGGGEEGEEGGGGGEEGEVEGEGGGGERSGPVRFEIETSIPLPAPLGPLEWTFAMVRQDASVLTRELVLPALRVVDVSGKREEDLRRKMREKDHVIGKLMDKIEGSGIDLAMVFPGFAGSRKGLTAAQAAKVVPGIEAFREERRHSILKTGDDDDDEGGMKGILEALTDPETGNVKWRGPMVSIRESDNERQGRLKQNLDQIAHESSKQKSTRQPAVEHDGSAESSVSSETSHLNLATPRQPRSSSPSPTPLRGKTPISRHRTTKLGDSGRKESKHLLPLVGRNPSSPPFSDRSGKASRRLSSPSIDTVSGSGSESEPEPEPEPGPGRGGRGGRSPSRNPTPKRPTTPKLGVIGGKKKKKKPVTVDGKKHSISPPPSSAATSQNATPSKGKSKIGIIGGKTTGPARRLSPLRDSSSPTTATGTPSPPPERGTSPSLSPHPTRARKRSLTPPKAEEPMTEAERANRRRMELKRQLDQGPRGKKKRKF